MRIVNVVATCIKVLEVSEDVPYVEAKNGRRYYFPLSLFFPGAHYPPQKRIIANVFRTGKVKLFSPVYPLPNIPYFSNCKIENIVAVAAIPAIPFEELLDLMEKRGFTIGDREKVNAVLAYHGETTVRIFPKADSDTYKVVIFAKTKTAIEEAVRLLLPGPPTGMADRD
jgi:hypothetical protein